MTDAEADAVLSWCGPDGELKSLVERLRAHAQLWRGATGMMREHAWYIDEAADEIDRLSGALKPFASFAKAMRVMQTPKVSTFPKTGELYTLMVPEGRVELTVEDFKAAESALQVRVSPEDADAETR